MLTEAVQLAEWAATMLIGAEQLGIKDKPVARFPLPWAERAVLLLFTAIDKKTLKKLEAEKPILTVGEVGGLLMAVAEAILDAPPSQCNALQHDRQELDGLSGSRGNGGIEAHTRVRELECGLSTRDYLCGHRACDLTSGRGTRTGKRSIIAGLG